MSILWYVFFRFAIAIIISIYCFFILKNKLAIENAFIITANFIDRFIFAILAVSASYITVPAAMKIAVPNVNPALYLPMALAITFSFNITIGMPIYYLVETNF